MGVGGGVPGLGRRTVHTFSGKITMNIFTGYIMKNGSIWGGGGGGGEEELVTGLIAKAEQ